MGGVDLSKVDPSTTIGQVIVLIVVLGTLITTAKPLFVNFKGFKSQRNLSDVAGELEEFHRQNLVFRKTNRLLTDWQTLARELISLYRFRMADNNVNETARMKNIREQLRSLEDDDHFYALLAREEDRL